VVLKLWVPFTSFWVGKFGSDHVKIFPESKGVAVLDAAFGAAVRDVLIIFAGVTVETLLIISP
jgi:hypothetical protein